MNLQQQLIKWLVPAEVHKIANKINKETGELGYDPWGYNHETAKIGLSLVKKLYDHYFRVKAFGLDNIPKKGRAFVIANHSGQLPMDGMLIGVAIATNSKNPRAPRAMIERFFPTVPFLGNILTRFGAVIGDPINCVKMLEREEVVVVFPEGVRGSGKAYRDKYELQRFGTGFVRIAIETKTPIIPVGVVGCEETMPSLGNVEPLAKLLGVPYIPITVPIPLPARVFLNFGEPLVFDGDVDSEAEMEEKVEEVKNSIRELIKKGLDQRGSIF